MRRRHHTFQFSLFTFHFIPVTAKERSDCGNLLQSGMRLPRLLSFLSSEALLSFLSLLSIKHIVIDNTKKVVLSGEPLRTTF